ncbi:MAG: WecB/TagA/CpsF family glycosyltransferase [Bacteroidota bacterium]|nr:WecB/TagA/CpsF family glycosyltransferase [Bacteroidota bacterium]
MKIKKILISDLDLHYGSFRDFTNYIFEKIESDGSQLIIVHINLNNYYLVNKDKTLYTNIKNNSIAVFEGIGLKLCMAVKGNGLLKDLNGTDLFPLFLKKLKAKGLGIFLLGASQESVKKTYNHIKQNYPGVKVLGYHNGYFKKSDEERIVESVNKSGADVLMIGMGFPLQENFVFKYRNKLNAVLIWNLGGLFDIISGFKPRAPMLIRRVRLEWLYRFFKEPIRMFHRNTIAAIWSIGNILFFKKN